MRCVPARVTKVHNAAPLNFPGPGRDLPTSGGPWMPAGQVRSARRACSGVIVDRRFGEMPEAAPASGEPEAALVARIAARDQRAFAEFYALYRRRLARFLGRVIASPGTVDELINDVMYVVWQDAARFQLRSKVSTWVFGIAWHKALKALERQRRGAGPEGPEPDELPAENRGALEERDWLRRGLDRLSPEHRLVVELTFFVGCSYGEIAAIADCPVNTVKTRMFHARRKLRGILNALDANGPEDGS
jgi:RNA polymerase sigma-70 factor, ECF subfamily